MKRLMIFASLGLLLVLLLAACGKEKEITPAPTPTATATPSPTPITTATPSPTPTATPVPTATPTPTTSGPVKIGGIGSWSGPTAVSGVGIADPIIKLVETQVKNSGGILGGREVKVIRYDNRATVSEATAGATKLYYDDKVSAIVWGGISTAEFEAVVSAVEELHILYVSIGHIDNLAEKKFVVNGTTQREVNRETTINFINKVLKPKTAAFLGTDTMDARTNWPAVKEGIKAAGTEIVYEQYVSLDTTDYSPFLTKMKYANPDVLYLYSGQSEFYMGVAKQIMELGGWGDIQVVGMAGGEAARKMPGADGWYMQATWAPGLDYPGAVKFQQDYKAIVGGTPTASHVYFYNCLWTAIYAMKLAGTDTDRVAIAQAARSGKLEWDTPMGRAHYAPDGSSGLSLIIERVVGGNLVLVPMPE